MLDPPLFCDGRRGDENDMLCAQSPQMPDHFPQVGDIFIDGDVLPSAAKHTGSYQPHGVNALLQCIDMIMLSLSSPTKLNPSSHVRLLSKKGPVVRALFLDVQLPSKGVPEHNWN